MTSLRKPTDDWLDDVWRYVFPWLAGAFLLVVFAVIPLGSLGLSAYIYLRTGEWINISTGLLSGWFLTTDWVGLNAIGNGALGLWVGVPSIALGAFAVWLYVNRETL